MSKYIKNPDEFDQKCTYCENLAVITIEGTARCHYCGQEIHFCDQCAGGLLSEVLLIPIRKIDDKLKDGGR